MKKNHLLPNWVRHALGRLPAGMLTAALLLCCFPLLEAQAAPASGDPDVVITDINATHSTGGAQASAQIDENGAAVLDASLPIPGAWAYFTVTIENQGSQPATLSQTLQNAQLPPELQLSFGLSGLEQGQPLEPGAQCTASILVQVDQDELSPTLSADGDFTLSLTYDATAAEGGNDGEQSGQSGTASTPGQDTAAPKTADGALPLLAGCGLLCAAGWLTLLRRRRA